MKNKIFSMILLTSALICSSNTFSMQDAGNTNNNPVQNNNTASGQAGSENSNNTGSEQNQNIFSTLFSKWNEAYTSTKVITCVAAPVLLYAGYKTTKFLYSGWTKFFALPYAAIWAMSKFGNYGPMNNDYWKYAQETCSTITSYVNGFFSNLFNQCLSMTGLSKNNTTQSSIDIAVENAIEVAESMDNSVLGAFKRMLKGK